MLALRATFLNEDFSGVRNPAQISNGARTAFSASYVMSFSATLRVTEDVVKQRINTFTYWEVLLN